MGNDSMCGRIIIMKLLTITIFAVALSIGSFYSVTFAQNGGPAVELRNWLGEGTTLMDLINRIIGGLQIIATPIVGLMVLIGAFQILFAGGDPNKFATGKKTIIYAVVGYAIIWIAGGIATLITNVLSGGT